MVWLCLYAYHYRPFGSILLSYKFNRLSFKQPNLFLASVVCRGKGLFFDPFAAKGIRCRKAGDVSFAWGLPPDCNLFTCRRVLVPKTFLHNAVLFLHLLFYTRPHGGV
jgi:hypothetical protein